MDWVCVCSDIEAITRPSSDDGDISSVAWAPLMGRDAECIAVSRGAVVRLFAIQGLLQHATAEDSIQLRQVRTPFYVSHCHLVSSQCFRQV